MTLDASPALTQDHFLSIGTADTVDESHYYEPRGDDLVTTTQVAKAIGVDGDWLVLAGGTRLQLSACPIASCAILDIDASKHDRAVQLQLALPRGADEPLYGTGDAADRANVAGAVPTARTTVRGARGAGLQGDLLVHSVRRQDRRQRDRSRGGASRTTTSSPMMMGSSSTGRGRMDRARWSISRATARPRGGGSGCSA